MENKELIKAIYLKFTVGNKYPLAEIKTILKEVYAEFGFKKTAKANDIENFFNTRYVYTTDKDTGKRIVNYEILSRLE